MCSYSGRSRTDAGVSRIRSAPTVRDGPQTYNEMMNGFLFYVDAKERLGLRIDEKTGAARRDPAVASSR